MVLILLTELKPLLHSAVVGEIVSIMRIRIIICSMCCASAEFISPTRGVLFNQLVYCMAIFTNKQVKIFTVIYHIMPIPCNNMVNSIENANIRGSCGILW